MTKKNLSILLSAAFALCAYADRTPKHGTSLFDDGWQFTQNGTTVTVDLPHDWDIAASPNPETGTTGTDGGWYPGGKGAYRKTFTTPDGELVRLHFEGVYQQAVVYVNGKQAGRHAYGYTPFTVDVTPYLNPDKRTPNELLVTVDNSRQPNCRWYTGSGIYRHVWLQTMSRLHIGENGVFVTTPSVSPERATVRVEVTVCNESATPRQAEVSVKGASQTVFLEAGEEKQVTLEYGIDRPQLWSPDTPHLYETEVTLTADGSETDCRKVCFGVRTFSFDAERGFVLNGEPLLLNGACVHHDDGVLGAMAFDRAEIRKVRQMKDAGFNLIRTSHNPTTRAFMDACDSIGMLVIDEAFDGWRSKKTAYDYHTLIDSCYREDIAALVTRDRNHPSVICWSIGNEVIERKDIRVITTARQLKREVLRHDPTRPVTEALCAWDGDWEIYDPHFEVLDVAGYNYMIHKHEGDHARDPRRVMWQTESYPRDAFKNWAVVHDHPYIVGDIVWTGLDYLGESGIGRYYYAGQEPDGEHYRKGGQSQWHGAYCGDVDITGWRKPISHYRQILWNETEGSAALRLAVKEPSGYHGEIKETLWSVWPTWESWNWAGWEGRPIEVEVYTKAAAVSLYLNGKPVETKQVSRDTEYKAVFTLPYEAGELRAVSFDAAGNELATATLATAGEPAALRLTADRTQLTADGQDIAFVTLEVIDREGRVVPDAAIPCRLSVSGQGSLLSVASANLKDTEAATSPQVTTWKGRALAVVRTTKKGGNIRLTVQPEGLPVSKVTVKTKR